MERIADASGDATRSGGILPDDLPRDVADRARTSVIVNGALVVENATHTEALPGKALRRDRDGRVG